VITGVPDEIVVPVRETDCYFAVHGAGMIMPPPNRPANFMGTSYLDVVCENDDS
jgi:hypothetical protein